jgi:hypothetical protein
MRVGSSLAHGKRVSLSTFSGTVVGEGGEGGDGGNRSGVLAVQPVHRIMKKHKTRVTNMGRDDFTGVIIKKNAIVCNFLFCRDVVQYRTRHRAIFLSPSEHR